MNTIEFLKDLYDEEEEGKKWITLKFKSISFVSNLS